MTIQLVFLLIALSIPLALVAGSALGNDSSEKEER